MAIESLAFDIQQHITLEFPTNIPTYHVDAQTNGSLITQTRTSMAPTHNVTIRHTPNSVQLWTTVPLARPCRILLVDYSDYVPARACIGYLYFIRDTVHVSDYRLSLARGHIPELVHPDLVYVVGFRFPRCMPSDFNIRIHMTANARTVTEEITLVKRDIHDTLIRCLPRLAVRPRRNYTRLGNIATRVTYEHDRRSTQPQTQVDAATRTTESSTQTQTTQVNADTQTIQTRESDLCVICRDNERELALVPCGHFCLCRECHAALEQYAEQNRYYDPTFKSQCPLCRAPYDTATQVYL